MTHELAWRTSSYSDMGEKCVEVAPLPEGAVIRHSKHPALGVIPFPDDAWQRFLAETVADTPSANGVVTVTRTPDGGATVTPSDAAAPTLTFDPDEWSAFTAGTRAGEFTFA